jgi:branched-chain amino acid transport system substrate-binding protein
MSRTVPAIAVATALLLTGCGAVDTVIDRVQPGEDAGTPTVAIGVLAPLTGGQTRVGTEVAAAVEQAVADSGGVPGWAIEVQVVDLAAPGLAADLEEMTLDDALVAVVTGFGADDVRTVVPVLDESGVTVLSPADSDPRHVQGADPGAPLRPWPGYLTTAVDPTPEQSALAGHLVRAAGVSSVLVVTDGSSAAQSRAATLTEALQVRGLARVRVADARGERLGPAAEPIGRLRQDAALVVDGSVPLAVTAAAARPAGTTLALMARPDLTDEQAAALDGAVAPDRGLDPRRGSAELHAALEPRDEPVSPGPYGPAAYDTGRLLVDAFVRCLPDPTESASPSRSACRAEVAGARWGGLTGQIAFDEFGARLGLLPAVLTLSKGEWAAPGG